MRQFVTESMLLAVLGGVSGVLLAQWALQALVAFGADLIPRVLEIRIDPLALGFALIATLVTGVAIGLLPAMQARASTSRNAEGREPRIDRRRAAAARRAVGRRNVFVARA